MVTTRGAKRQKTGNRQVKLRLLPEVVDDLAAERPAETWIAITRSNSEPDGYHDISYKQLSNAVNAASAWLQASLPTFAAAETITYLGPSDSRYFVFIIAAIKLGHNLFLLSPRNDETTQSKLLRAAGCKHILCSASYAEYAASLITNTELGLVPSTILLVPDETTLLEAQPSDLVYKQTFADVRHQVALTIHTSGSSGPEPKIVKLTHGYFAHEDTLADFPDQLPLTYTLFQGARCLHAVPLYHAAGVLFGLMKGLYQRTKWVLPPADAQLTSDIIAACLDKSSCDSLKTVPSLVKPLLENQQHSEILTQLKWIWIGGGTVAKEVGDSLIKLNQSFVHGYGSTEMGLLSILAVEPGDWQYHRFHAQAGVNFEALDDDHALHELTVVKHTNENIQYLPYQPCFEIYPEAATFRSGDLWSPHPTKVNLWKYEGRNDDMVVLSTGEKFNAHNAETFLQELEEVSTALIVGGHQQPVLVLETSRQLQEIWQQVDHANKFLPQHVKLNQALTVVVAPEQALPRSAKGLIQRHTAVQRLQPQIQMLFGAHASNSTTKRAAIDLREQVEMVIKQKLGKELNSQENLFAVGMDSMQVAKIVRSINKRLRQTFTDTGETVPHIAAKHVFRHHSIEALTSAVTKRVQRHFKAAPKTITWEAQSRRLRATHRELLTSRIIGVSMIKKQSGRSVILTGSTGSLGTHMLHELLQSSEFQRILCLDRSPNGRSSYLEAFPEDEARLSNVDFVQVHDFDLKQAGDSFREKIRLYRPTCRMIVHNAWPINFHLPLSTTVEQASVSTSSATATYQIHLDNLHYLLNLARDCPHNPRLVFISSLAAVLNANPIPEAVVVDINAPDDTDYARSKWLGEMLLNDSSAIDASVNWLIIRIGQIAGPLMALSSGSTGTGTWNRNEVIPSMIRSSAVIGALPDNLREKDKLRWTPVDVCAQSILESTRLGEPRQVVSIANIHYDDTSWSSDIVHLLQTRFNTSDRPCSIVPLAEWIRLVDEYGAREDNPAIKLLDFYQKLIYSNPEGELGGQIVQEKTLALSKSLRALEPVKRGMVREMDDQLGSLREYGVAF